MPSHRIRPYSPQNDEVQRAPREPREPSRLSKAFEDILSLFRDKKEPPEPPGPIDFIGGQQGTGTRKPPTGRRLGTTQLGGITYPNLVLERWTAKNRRPFVLASGAVMGNIELLLAGPDIAPISFDANAAQKLFLLWINTALNDLHQTLDQNAPAEYQQLRNSQKIYVRQKSLKFESGFAVTSVLDLDIILEIVAVEYATWVRRYQNYRRYGDSPSGTERDWLSGSLNNMVARHSHNLIWKRVWRRK